MARAKYKLGTMVQHDSGDGTLKHGTVAAIITYEKGYQYVLDGDEPNDAIKEESITAAFRPVIARKVVAKKTAAKKPAAKKSAKHDSDSATVQ